MDDNPYRAPQTHRYSHEAAEPDDAPEEVVRGPLHHEFDPTGILFAALAQGSGLVIDGLRFIFDSRAWAADLLHLSARDPLSALQLCTAVVRYAQEIFPGQALDALRDWGIIAGPDVGRYAVAMLRAGILSDPDFDSPDKFAEIGVLRQFA